MDYSQICAILAIPFAGTVIGAACVFFQKKEMPQRVRKALMGFAAGVMVAASVWSLLIPSMEFCDSSGVAKVIPATVGFFLGILFLLGLDHFTPHQHVDSNMPEGPQSRLSKTSKLALAVTIHNIPEGIAVGISLAGAMDENAIMSISGALALALGIAIQNFPEGAIVSMPMRELGNTRKRSFGIGVLSGFVEPIASIITIWIASLVLPVFPYLLAFGAGAMMYVVVEELIPETAEGKHSNLGTLGFAVGFALMMVLDVVLG
ncbi:MAG: ZIP family metal transporter [Muribaculaceae bacterium]|nr:ZIP family metal transporter [Muribaculaceae bacterium]